MAANPAMSFDSARQTFVVECEEHLRAMEHALLALEAAPGDLEPLTEAFRAAHTIKGSAGIFELDSIVAFAHELESILDRLRDGALQAGHDLIATLLVCGDHLGELVRTVAAQGIEPDEELRATGGTLVAALQAWLKPAGVPAAAPRGEPLPVPHEGRVEVLGGTAEGEVGADTWHLSVRFGRDVLRNGMDPLSIFRYLRTLGRIVSLSVLADALPAAAEMDPEACYLGFELDLKSDADKEAIAGAFDFVRDDSEVHILPPHSRILEFIRLLEKLPEDKNMLGELLVSSGALTRGELDAGLAQQSEPGEQPALGEILVAKGDVPPEMVDAALAKQRHSREHAAREARYVRVHADKLDQLVDLVGELVISSASTNLLARKLRDDALHESASNMVRLVEEIRDGTLQLRMVQIGETFNRFPRLVRDVGHELGKDIELVITGAETELDKSMVERISDPLMHLVRNAIDHGIEPAAAREARGKPARGRVFLNAYHDSGSIVIEVADDGEGMNRDRILKKAIERGMVAPEQPLGDQEVFNLVWEAGFSTAEQLSNISGRGVGMDVVKRNIDALRGMVEIDSTPGEGTTMRMRLPLTLAIIDGFLIGVGNAAYVVPLDMVVECLELGDKDLGASAGSNYVNLRGEVLPFVRLRELFEIEAEKVRRENIVVVRYGGQRAGIVVDRLMGEIQTVIKPLSRIFAQLKGIGGSTILGTGEVALILDVPSLIGIAGNAEAAKLASSKVHRLAPAIEPAAKRALTSEKESS